MIYNKKQNLSLINKKKFKEKMYQYMLYQIQINHIYYFNTLFHNPFFEHFKNQFMNFEKFLANFQKQRNNAFINEEKIINDEINENQFDKTINNSIDTDISSNSINSSPKDGNEKKDFSKKTNNLLTNFSNLNAYNINEIKKSQKIENENETKKNNSISLNKETEEFKGNPIYENTEILRVSVKISNNNAVFFKIKRYDDVFETIKLFCEINGINEKLIKPIIVKSLSTLNTVYQIMNCQLNNEQINILKKINSI